METINSMKKRIKEGLDEGTHVSPEVYDLLAKTTNWFAERLVENTIMRFEKSDNSRMTTLHVIEGYFYHMTKHKVEENIRID